MSEIIQSGMSVQGHYRLAKTFHYMSLLPPVILSFLCVWVLPKLPPLPPEKSVSFEIYFLGVTMLSAVLCDTLFFLRLRRFRALPTRSEQAEHPPVIEVKRGWWACGIAWGLAQVFSVFGVIEALLTRSPNALIVFLAFTGITLYRCRPRHGLFAESHWGQKNRQETSGVIE